MSDDDPVVVWARDAYAAGHLTQAAFEEVSGAVVAGHGPPPNPYRAYPSLLPPQLPPLLTWRVVIWMAALVIVAMGNVAVCLSAIAQHDSTAGVLGILTGLLACEWCIGVIGALVREA